MELLVLFLAELDHRKRTRRPHTTTVERRGGIAHGIDGYGRNRRRWNTILQVLVRRLLSPNLHQLRMDTLVTQPHVKTTLHSRTNHFAFHARLWQPERQVWEVSSEFSALI